MTRLVCIVGTDHVFQFGAGIRFGSRTCSPMQEARFTEFLVSVCRRRGIRALAEELSRAALAEQDCIESVPHQVARSLVLPHAYCDPDRGERSVLGIAEDTAIQATGQMNSWPEERVQAVIQEHWRKREAHWLRGVLQLRSWPVLFICGASHVLSFAAMVRAEGIDSSVEAECWDA